MLERTPATIATTVVLGSILVAATAPAAEEAHEFDFWVGEWDVIVRNLQADGSWSDVATAAARVYPVLDGKAILELWDGQTPRGGDDPAVAGLTTKGFSLRYYDPARRRWLLALNWPGLDSPGFSKLEGTFRHGRGEFYRLGFLREAGAEVRIRYTFSDIDDDRLRWDDGYSQDGGQTWGAGAVFEFTRTRRVPRWPGPGESLVTYDDGALCKSAAASGLDLLEGSWVGRFEPAVGSAEPSASASLVAYRALDGCAILALFERGDPAGVFEDLQLLSFLPQRQAWVALRLDSRPETGYELLEGRLVEGQDGGELDFTTVRPEPMSNIGPWSRSLDGVEAHPERDSRRSWRILGNDELEIVLLESSTGGAEPAPAGSYRFERER